MTEPDYKLPPGCADAVRKHFRINPDDPNDVYSLKDRVEAWREDPKGNEGFEGRILDAVRGGDFRFLEALAKAAALAPALKLTATEAALSAFFTLFVIERQCQGWPTKKQVRVLAEKILQKNGHPTPGKRYWTQLFEATGLSELPEAPSGRPKK